MRRRAERQCRRRRTPSGGLYWPLIGAVLALVLALGLWAWQSWGGAAGGRGQERKPTPTPVPVLAVTLYEAVTRHTETLPLEEYLVGVVAAEMPADFAMEALKAQAVAARTRTVKSLRAGGGAGCAAHPGADICSDSTHCQAWADEATLRRRWGETYAANAEKVAAAVRATAGEIITYQGEPILVLYHAASGGETEDVEHVFAQALPYLRGVASPGEESFSKYETEQRLALTEAAEALNAALPKARVQAGALAEQVAVLERFASGRVHTIRVGQTTCDGRAFRQALGLNSANFSLAFTKDELVIAQRGYGHGVGMSQTGADAMARAGSGYQEILRHYYAGVAITKI